MNPEDNLLNNIEQPTDGFLEKYVGEGKKFKTVEDLAKSYEHADRHIATMNEDNRHMREEFESFRDLVTKQIATREPTPNAEPTPSPAPQPVPQANAQEGDEESLDAKIAKILDEKDQDKRFRDNARLAEEVLVKHFGSKEDAQKAVVAKANELGVNPQWLANTAFESPKALFVAMGVNPDQTPRSTTTPVSTSDVNVHRLTETNSAAKPGSYAYFEDIRRKDPKRYFTQEVQSQVMAAAMAAAAEGRDFYKS